MDSSKAKKVAMIFSGGACREPEFYREYLSQGDLVIAADGGGGILFALGVVPHVLIGDMDSIGDEQLRNFEDQGVEVITMPQEKDYTDTELAFNLALEREADEILIFGAMGGRIDHALANLSLLILGDDKGVITRIVDEDQELTLLTCGGKNRIPGRVGETISLVSLSYETTGIDTKDLKYPLDNGTLSFLSPNGVSNVIAGLDPEVSYREGRLLLARVRNP